MDAHQIALSQSITELSNTLANVGSIAENLKKLNEELKIPEGYTVEKDRIVLELAGWKLSLSESMPCGIYTSAVKELKIGRASYRLSMGIYPRMISIPSITNVRTGRPMPAHKTYGYPEIQQSRKELDEALKANPEILENAKAAARIVVKRAELERQIHALNEGIWRLTKKS